MNTLLNRMKRYGKFLALVPFLMAITVTLPKLYLEVIGTDIFGTREILKAEVIEKSRTEAILLTPETCGIKLKINQSYQRESLDCQEWEEVEVGDVLDRVDAWTVWNSLDEVTGHAILDAILALIEIGMIVFLLNMRAFITWLEKQTNSSPPIFIGHSPKKETL